MTDEKRDEVKEERSLSELTAEIGRLKGEVSKWKSIGTPEEINEAFTRMLAIVDNFTRMKKQMDEFLTMFSSLLSK